MNENRTTVVLALIVSITIITVWLIYSSQNASRNIEQANLSKISQSPSSSYETKERSENNVTVSITPQALTINTTPSFYVEFETHSVELDFDVPEVTLLVDDQKNSFGQAIWEGAPPGGHHRKGTLSFASNLQKSTKSVTLTFSNIGDVPTRTFIWEVKK